MTIQPNTNFADGDYETTLFDTLKLLEGVESQPYADTRGIPTIGIGVDWGCGQKLGLLGGSPCIHTKSAFVP